MQEKPRTGEAIEQTIANIFIAIATTMCRTPQFKQSALIAICHAMAMLRNFVAQVSNELQRD